MFNDRLGQIPDGFNHAFHAAEERVLIIFLCKMDELCDGLASFGDNYFPVGGMGDVGNFVNLFKVSRRGAEAQRYRCPR